MRFAGLVLSAAMLVGCATTQVEPKITVGAASAEAAARAEFSVVAMADREPFPVWSGSGVDGYAWNTENLPTGVTVVNFWASWCQPCRDEWPELQAAAEGHPSVRFLGIDTRDDVDEARRFVSDNPTQYRHLSDPEAGILRQLTQLPSSMLPTTVILDREHRVAAWKVGPVKRGQIRRALATLQAQG